MVKKLPGSQVLLEISVPSEEVMLLKDKAAATLSERIDIAGFRRGKAPYDAVARLVGSTRVFEEAGYFVIEKKYREAIDQNNLCVIGQPKIEILKIAEGNPLEFKITVAVYPEVKLADYKKIAEKCRKEKKQIKLDDKEVEEALANLRRSRSKQKTVSRPARKGDLVEIDFEVRQGGVKIEGGGSRNHPLIIGENKFIPGFEDELLDLNAGEEKEFSLTAPADYPKENLRGKTLEIKAKMNLVSELEIPELTDELAKSFGKFDTAEALEKSVREGMTMEKEEEEKERLRRMFSERTAKESSMEIADILIDQEVNKMAAEFEQSTSLRGADFEQYLAHIKKTRDDLKKDFRARAEERVRIAVVLASIAQEEKISLDEEEVKKKMGETLARQHIEDPAAINQDLLHDYVSGIMRNEKVFELLNL